MQDGLPARSTARPLACSDMRREPATRVWRIPEITREPQAATFDALLKTVQETYNEVVVLGVHQEDARYVLPNAADEPGRMVGINIDITDQKRAEEALKLWASYSDADGGLIGQAADVRKDVPIQRTLVTGCRSRLSSTAKVPSACWIRL